MVDILLKLHIICLSIKKITAIEAACSDGSPEKRMWNTIWHANIPNKIKHFIWRSCKNTLPTRRNLVKKKVVANDICELCRMEPEDGIHALWCCIAARTFWACCSSKLRKSSQGYFDIQNLTVDMMDKLDASELNFFFF